MNSRGQPPPGWSMIVPLARGFCNVFFGFPLLGATGQEPYRLAFAPESVIWLSQITPVDTRHPPCRPRTEFSGRTRVRRRFGRFWGCSWEVFYGGVAAAWPRRRPHLAIWAIWAGGSEWPLAEQQKNPFAVGLRPKCEVYFPMPCAQVLYASSTHMGWRFWAVGLGGLDDSQGINTFLLK